MEEGQIGEAGPLGGGGGEKASAKVAVSFHGQRSLADCSPWSRKESDMTEHARVHAYRGNEGKRRSYGWALVQYDWCLTRREG